MNTAEILGNIEAAITQEPPRQVEPMQGDRWLVSSAMQKAIRRSETETALRAAIGLWLQDRQNFWRRLHVIALEDCGIGSPETVAAVLIATASPSWRRGVGDWRVGMHLVRLLCDIVKNRAADELLLWLEYGTEHRPMQEQLAAASDTELADCVADEHQPLAMRASALRCLAGTVKLPSENLPSRKGSFDAAAIALRSLRHVSTELVEGCIAVMPRTQWPLSLYVPLLQQVAGEQPLRVKVEALATMPQVEGIPIPACDVYTRVGQTCFRQLQREVKELQPYNVRQIGVAVFGAEGGLLDRYVTSPLLDELQRHGELAYAKSTGLQPPEYQRLREHLARHADTLNRIRHEQLHRYLNGAESANLNAIQGKPTITHYDGTEA